MLVILYSFHIPLKKIMRKALSENVITLIYLLPLILIIYFDQMYHTFSVKNTLYHTMNIPYQYTEKYNPALNYLLRIVGAYGIIQVLAQDFGVKTGKHQAEFMRHSVVQWFLFTGTAYTLTNNRSEAMIASTLYFVLRNNISNGETQDVCFKDV